MQVSTIGIDLSKSVFQLHGVDEKGDVVLKRRLRRGQLLEFFAGLAPCRIGLEACGGAHHWGRELTRLGHEARLLPPAYVKPYVKRGKTDAADAEAICEACARPNMRIVPVKSVENQAVIALHKVRDHLVRQNTRLVNLMRSTLAEFGVVAAQGVPGAEELKAVVRDDQDARLPPLARTALTPVLSELGALQRHLKDLDLLIAARVKKDETCRRLKTVPGAGPIIASAVAARVGDARRFRSGRDFAAFLGLTPKPHSSGLKERKGRTSKMGDRSLRALLVVGATAMIARARRKEQESDGDELVFIRRLLKTKPARLVSLAYANKMARILWALMVRGGTYEPRRRRRATTHIRVADRPQRGPGTAARCDA